MALVLNNLIDFSDVFNAVRKDERELIVQLIMKECVEAEHYMGETACENCEKIIDLIEDLPLPVKEKE